MMQRQADVREIGLDDVYNYQAYFVCIDPLWMILKNDEETGRWREIGLEDVYYRLISLFL